MTNLLAQIYGMMGDNGVKTVEVGAYYGSPQQNVLLPTCLVSNLHPFALESTALTSEPAGQMFL